MTVGRASRWPTKRRGPPAFEALAAQIERIVNPQPNIVALPVAR
jgi:hypothetical protein